MPCPWFYQNAFVGSILTKGDVTRKFISRHSTATDAGIVLALTKPATAITMHHVPYSLRGEGGRSRIKRQRLGKGGTCREDREHARPPPLDRTDRGGRSPIPPMLGGHLAQEGSILAVNALRGGRHALVFLASCSTARTLHQPPPALAVTVRPSAYRQHVRGPRCGRCELRTRSYSAGKPRAS